MKKVLLTLALFLGLANSLFAISINDIDLGTHERAYITQVHIADSRVLDPNYQDLLAKKFNGVSYDNWSSTYPLDSLKYQGHIDSWVYTFDYINFYYYDPIFDLFLLPTDLSVTYIYVKYPSYSSNSLELKGGGITISNPVYEGNNVWKYTHIGSKDVNYYEVITGIIPDEGGTVFLYNNISINRLAQ